MICQIQSRSLGHGQKLGLGKQVELITVVAKMCHIPLLMASGQDLFSSFNNLERHTQTKQMWI